jgi:hypothetical protein
MTIRSQRNMVGGNYKPSWQEVSLNIFCWIGLAISAFQIIMVFVNKTQATGPGASGIAFNAAGALMNVFILQRNDFWMSIAKWLYIIGVMFFAFCGCILFGAIGTTYGQTKQGAILAFVLATVQGIYCGFMAYLLHFEGEV